MDILTMLLKKLLCSLVTFILLITDLSISKDAERRLLMLVCCQLCPFWRPVKEKESKRSAYLLSGKYFFSKDYFFYVSQRILFSSSNLIWLILALHAWTNQLLTLKMLVFLSICQVSSTLYGIELAKSKLWCSAKISERMSCEESTIFFANHAYIPI